MLCQGLLARSHTFAAFDEGALDTFAETQRNGKKALADQQRARALFGLALNATAVVGWAALLLLFRIHPPEPRHPGLVVVVALMRCLVSLYLRHSATPW